MSVFANFVSERWSDLDFFFSLSMVFTRETSRGALKKRKSRFTRINVTAKVARKAKHINRVRVKRTVARQNAAFRNNTASGGANNAMTPTSVETVLEALSCARRLTKDSVVVDFGCGSGNVLVAAVLRYGAKAYGIEKDEAAYEAACANVKKLESPEEMRRIHLLSGSFNEKRFGPNWLRAIGATHVVMFDKAFNIESAESLFKTLSAGPHVVGVSSTRPNSKVKLPRSFVDLGSIEKPVAVIGGQKFKMKLWTNGK